MSVKAYQTVGKSLPHESAHLHVMGSAQYTDDIPEFASTLHAAIGMSARAHARIVSMDLSAVASAPGVVAVVTLDDVPGEKYHGPYQDDEPVFADGKVEYLGQPMFAVAATSHDLARRAVSLAKIEYEDLDPVLTVEEGAARKSYVLPPVHISKGNVPSLLEQGPNRHQGELHCGGQEQFYLEGQVAYAMLGENNEIQLYSSTQHPSEMQAMVAHILGQAAHTVKVQCRRMGGGFGGKESQSWPFAAAAALLAKRTGRPVKVRADRDDDFMITGKRHDFRVLYDVAYTDDGLIKAVAFEQQLRCGFSADLSGAVADRQVFHSDNAYYLEAFDILSLRIKTNSQSNTAFRGFGGPQGILCIEYVIDDIARRLGKDPLDVRKLNFYGRTERNVTPYQMVVEDNVVHELVDQLEASSKYRERRKQVDQFNAQNRILKKGLALVPVKFGISFTATFLNQAGALLHVYTDGSALINHGGTEMGQGLNTKVAQVVAEELGIDMERVRVSSTDTSKVPNTSATAASTGTDLNGKAAQDAARKIKAALVEFAADHYGCDAHDIVFRSNQVVCGDRVTLSFADFVQKAYMARVPLWSSGFYKTPKIHYDLKTLTGRPFYYFVYAAACAEVIIDTLTGENRLVRADILYDAGRSINPAVDLGQVEGGFIQGVGWLTTEELWWDAKGKLMTHAPSTYKIPSVSDCPEALHVEFFENGNTENNIFQSKAMGEPPLPTAISVFLAIRDAIASTAAPGVTVPLDAPATAERVLWALDKVKEGSELCADMAAFDADANVPAALEPVMSMPGPGAGNV
ncbi:xanthine dehydrogenase molybdopterin binding subunit [Eoetvoesiella caeni]|uniref:Xanthine dehydrogenase molybdenum binding subunit apoprotein n=1 Tax=Eoetvoesiella caeni TaxID=645616 RepID=A0A366HHS2_9BURK|nr:xanthine dehydrogenase molybdopterin binding subunit [Eoetvoesiella caeni]MCI2808404.1 xanthine dehydrogenase molybdopterin binding subunit [Eoetvoesiella caeni]NYT54945.1 xanthine dehydrogenase molybdopterin binding subunit [Eoetvoesiella caeni]RBP41082.1 xanthine dehydrogenase molybdenum binding subunit apoprotein [Eoetvoesiella caeni]